MNRNDKIVLVSGVTSCVTSWLLLNRWARANEKARIRREKKTENASIARIEELVKDIQREVRKNTKK